MSRYSVAILTTRASDWEVMRHASDLLKEFGIEAEHAVVRVTAIAKQAVEFQARGTEVLIVGESASSAGVRAAASATIPVLVTPIQTKSRAGAMPLMEATGFDVAPTGVLAIGVAGAKNAALSAIAILALKDSKLARKYESFRKKQTEKVLKNQVPKLR